MLNKTIIIAEAGVNHNGSVKLAKKLIDIAAEANADYVKFQTYKTENLVSNKATMADYQLANLDVQPGEQTQFDMLKKLELTQNDFIELKQYCEIKKIKFLSTAFDLESLDFLNSLGLDFFKVPSGEITNYPYLKKIGSFGKKIILSSGMCDMFEIKQAISLLVKSGTSHNNITVLHCTTDYPTDYNDVNLNAMLTIKEELNVNIGYSDHTLGIEVALGAVTLGATIIEKHFTIDKLMEGPDHKASLNPTELANLVGGIRAIEKSLGSNIKIATLTEQKNKLAARKSIHIIKNLSAGHILTESDLIMKRPGTGISPMLIETVVGKKIKTNLEANHLLNNLDLE
ncbi:MAG TPA: N-acetylneuraminate synthase [Saprospiraceae bacterium]|nr:N-acetylneuraminate synthase [Saprospiraceae bacterium]